jgi:hypothetical protein
MNFSYSSEDWFIDWGWILESSLTLQKENSMEEARKFFRSRYTNPSEADWKLDRILKAYHYLDKHLDLFEKASLALASKKQATIGRPLATALYRFFGHASDKEVVNEPPPEIIVAAAQEHLND